MVCCQVWIMNALFLETAKSFRRTGYGYPLHQGNVTSSFTDANNQKRRKIQALARPCFWFPSGLFQMQVNSAATAVFLYVGDRDISAQIIPLYLEVRNGRAKSNLDPPKLVAAAAMGHQAQARASGIRQQKRRFCPALHDEAQIQMTAAHDVVGKTLGGPILDQCIIGKVKNFQSSTYMRRDHQGNFQSAITIKIRDT